MYEIIVVTNNRKAFSSWTHEIADKNRCVIGWDDSMEKARERASGKTPHLMVIDETVDGLSNLEIARQIVLTNPMINLALVSPLSPKDFHEASEGLGIVAQLPRCPGKGDASKLMETLQSILSPKRPL